METLVAACGLVCSKCEAFIGTRAGDAELIRQTAEEWSRKYGVPVPPEAVWCSGCMPEGGPKCATVPRVARCGVACWTKNTALAPIASNTLAPKPLLPFQKFRPPVRCWKP